MTCILAARARIIVWSGQGSRSTSSAPIRCSMSTPCCWGLAPLAVPRLLTDDSRVTRAAQRGWVRGEVCFRPESVREMFRNAGGIVNPAEAVSAWRRFANGLTVHWNGQRRTWAEHIAAGSFADEETLIQPVVFPRF